MAILTWGDADQKFYEAGVDRGVFYPNAGNGVAWNGLISVSENSSGGSVKSSYLDGKKYIDIVEGEDFKADIEAFSAPSQFLLCDGIKAIANGLFVTQQPRTTFGFSYRTNKINGTASGYKIHLVYNATAAPSQRDNVTLSDSVDPSRLKWTIETVPPVSAIYKPSAHMVVDSFLADPDKLSDLEDILYGTAITNPRLPTQTEIYALFTAP